jgi:aminoglycoside phosphotransferase (APT) family kinase protein
MQTAEANRAVAAAMSTASEIGLAVDDAVVLNDSNRLVVRLMPCDTVARVTPVTHPFSAERELELVRRLAETDSPVAPLEARVEPRLFVRGAFTITMWAYFGPVRARMLPPAEYASALERLHAALREVEVATPRFLDRVAAVQHDVASQDVTPDLAGTDRALLADTLRNLSESIVIRRPPEQLLHGEPHPGNVLDTKNGLLFIDFENTTHGPIEYDLAWVPKMVSERWSHADQGLLGDCRGLVLAIIAAYRWRRDDEHPSGRPGGVAFLDAVRDGPPWPGLEDITW